MIDQKETKKTLEHLLSTGLVRRIKPEEIKEDMKKSIFWYITEKSREIYEYYTQPPKFCKI
ncbi:MAG: hypothetical protein ACFFCQ_14495 [Promethearchaeota archaeon]